MRLRGGNTRLRGGTMRLRRNGARLRLRRHSWTRRRFGDRRLRMKRQRAQQRHFNAHAAIGRQRQILAPHQQRLIVKLNVGGRHNARQFAQTRRVALFFVAERAGQQLHHRNAVQQTQHLHQQRLPLHAARRGLVKQGHHLFAAAVHQRLDQPQRLLVVQGAEHLADNKAADHALPHGDRLIGEAERVAHAAVGGARQQLQRARFVFDLLLLQHIVELFADQLNVERLKMKLQTAGEDSYRQLLRIGGGKQEFNVRRRLFERFQQRVKAVARQHMHFIDQVDLKAAARGRILHVVQQIARILHLGARRGVDLDQIDKAALFDLATVVAFAARRGGDAGFAVESLRQQARDGGFAHAARAGKEIGMMETSQ